jgi:hypothetical protein
MPRALLLSLLVLACSLPASASAETEALAGQVDTVMAAVGEARLARLRGGRRAGRWARPGQGLRPGRPGARRAHLAGVRLRHRLDLEAVHRGDDRPPAQEGKLSLDDDVRRFVPELPRYEEPITIRHLLHHTSGLRDYTDLMALAGWQMEDWTTAEQALATDRPAERAELQAGAQYLYSNTGFFLLSVIAARAGGKPFSRPRARADLRAAPDGRPRTSTPITGCP